MTGICRWPHAFDPCLNSPRWFHTDWGSNCCWAFNHQQVLTWGHRNDMFTFDTRKKGETKRWQKEEKHKKVKRRRNNKLQPEHDFEQEKCIEMLGELKETHNKCWKTEIGQLNPGAPGSKNLGSMTAEAPYFSACKWHGEVGTASPDYLSVETSEWNCWLQPLR